MIIVKIYFPDPLIRAVRSGLAVTDGVAGGDACSAEQNMQRMLYALEELNFKCGEK